MVSMIAAQLVAVNVSSKGTRCRRASILVTPHFERQKPTIDRLIYEAGSKPVVVFVPADGDSWLPLTARTCSSADPSSPQ